MSILPTFKFSDVDKRKTFTLAFLIGFAILVATGYSLWGVFLNYGNLELEGEAPFTVKVLEYQDFECLQSPCEFKLKPGLYDVIIQKENHKSLFTSAGIQRWETTTLKLNLEITPIIIAADQIPENNIDTSDQYSLTIDDYTGLQKLVRQDDPFSQGLIYFTNPIADPQIFSTYNKYLLILSAKGDVYKIDLRAKSREHLGSFPDLEIDSGSFSPDGRYFIFTHEKSDYLQILDTSTTSEFLKKTNLITDLTRYDWIYDNTIVFISSQAYVPSTTSTLGDYIGLSASESKSGLLLGRYYPQSGDYSKVDLDLPLSNFPDELIAALNGGAVYLKKGDEKFKIILRKF